MPRSQLYSVVFAGEVLAQRNVEQVKTAIAAQFRLQPEQVKRLFSGQRITIRRDLPLDQAQRLVEAFRRAGARCHLQPRLAADTAPATRTAAAEFQLSALAASRSSDALRQLAAGAILLLPILYPLAIILLIAFIVSHIVQALTGPPAIVVLIGHVLPALLAASLLLWLLRPLLSRRKKAAELVAEPNEVAQLQRLTERIADQLGRPTPAVFRFDLSLRVRARWQLHLLPPRRPVLNLHIGLPLLAVLDASQLAAALAYALATASAKAPTPLQLLDDSIVWLNRLAAGRGRVDTWVEAWIRRSGSHERELARLLQHVLRAPHWLLQGLAHATIWLAQPLLRRRQREALDRALQLAGGKGVADGLYKTRLLARVRSELELELKAVDGYELFCNNLPGLLSWLAARRAPELQEEIEQELYDFDPLIDDLSGLPQLIDKRSASKVVTDYASLAERLTEVRYRELGLQVGPGRLLPLSQACAALAARQRREEALSGYFRGCLLPRRVVAPLGFGEALALAPADRIGQLQQAVTEIRQAMPELLQFARRYPVALAALSEADVMVAVARFQPDPQAEPEQRRRQEALIKLEGMRAEYLSLFGRRLGIGLAEAVQGAKDAGRLTDNIKQASDALESLAALEPELDACRREFAIAAQLVGLRSSTVRVPAHILLTQLNSIVHRVERLHQALDSIRFDQATLGTLLRATLPTLTEGTPITVLEGHLQALDEALERVRRQLMGRLILLAGAAEARRGIWIRVVN